MRKLLAIISLLLTIALLQGFSRTKTDAERPGIALSTVRLVNTAEAYAHHAHGKYVSLSDLSSTGALKRAADLNESFSSTFNHLEPQKGAAFLNGFDFAIVISPDGSTYKLSIVEKEQCGIAYFTDDHGLIYSGKAVGCS